MRKLLGFTLIIVLCVVVLNFGGFSLNSFSEQIHLRDPGAILSPITNNIPKGHDIVGDIPNGGEGGYSFDPNAKLNGTTGSNNNVTYTPILSDENSSINNESNTSILNESSISNNSSTTEQSSVESKVSSETAESDNTTIESNKDFEDSSENSIENNSEDTDIANINNKIWSFTIGDQTLELTPDNTASFVKWLDTLFTTDNDVYYTNTNEYNNITNEDVSILIASINIVDELPKYTDYDRTTFEKPVVSYVLDDKKVNRNDYAWKTSKYFNEADFTYTCPYTGKVIADLDDKKEDQDFGNLDYDHIVSLSVVERSCPDWWTEKEKNAYAYDIAVGVDVINSSNRSKGDKTPSEWLPEQNQANYCYTYLLICRKYELTMSQADIDTCERVINEAIARGETIQPLNPYIS